VCNDVSTKLCRYSSYENVCRCDKSSVNVCMHAAKQSSTTCWTFAFVLRGLTRGLAWRSPDTAALRTNSVLYVYTVSSISSSSITYLSQGVASLPNKCQPPLPSARQHPSYGDCQEVKREYYQNCSVLGCVTQCSQSAAHSYEQFLQVQQIRFVTLGPLCHA